MRILITICLSCALVPTSALLGSKPHEKWYQNRDQKNPANAFNEPLPSAGKEPIRVLKRTTGIPVDFKALRAGELLSRDAVFTHGKEFLDAINHGHQQFDVYENNTAVTYDAKDFFELRNSDGKVDTYSYDSHTSYSLKYDVSSYHNLDDVERLMSFGLIRQFEDNHIVHCDHGSPILIGAILIGSSHGSWAKENEVEHYVAHTLSNLLLHPSHLAVRVDKGLTLLRQVVRTESFDSTGNEVCTKLHTESIHPLELFKTMRIESIAESPFQHMYSGGNPDPSTETTAPTKQNRKAMSAIVAPDYPLRPCGTPEERLVQDFTYSYYNRCVEYSADIPGSFNFNFNTLTGNAINPSLSIADGIECEECYAFLGAGILVILQYGINGSTFDVEVKGGGGAGLSAFINMKNPAIRGARELTLIAPETKFMTSTIGVLPLSYKFGGISAVISGSGSARGSLRFGTAQSAYGSQGLVYSSKLGLSAPTFFSYKSVAPSLSKSTLEVESLNVGLEIVATQNFHIGYSTYLSIDFDANIGGSIEYSFGSNSNALVSVRSGDDTSRALRTALGTSYLNFVPGDLTLIRFEYSDFNPLEETVLFYSIQKSDSQTRPIMQRNFTSSSTGSGIFEASWTVPWDFTFAGNGSDDMQIIVKASNSIVDKFESEPFATTLFTEHDGIFTAPHANEIIPVETPYTLRWASALLHYFRPAHWGTGFGVEVESSEVTFEVTEERLFPNGSVQSSISHKNLTQGPVPNTGECVVIFPRSLLLGTSERFYITVMSKDNTETAGWSKAYFKLTPERRVESVSMPVPVLASDDQVLSAPRISHVETTHSTKNRGLGSDSRRNLDSCDALEAKLYYKVKAGLAARKINALFFSWGLSYEISASIIPLTTTCKAGPDAMSGLPAIVSSTDPHSIVNVKLPLYGFTLQGAKNKLAAGRIRSSIGMVLGLSLNSVRNVTLSPTSRRSLVDRTSAAALSEDRYGATDTPGPRTRSLELANPWMLEYAIVADSELYSVDQLVFMMKEAQDTETLITQIKASEPLLSAASVGTIAFEGLPTAAPTASPSTASPPTIRPSTIRPSTTSNSTDDAVDGFSSSAGGAATAIRSMMIQWLLIGLGAGLFIGIIIGLLACFCRQNLKCCKSSAVEPQSESHL